MEWCNFKRWYICQIIMFKYLLVSQQENVNVDINPDCAESQSMDYPNLGQSYAMDSCVISSLSNFIVLRFSVGIRKDCWFCHWGTDSSRIVCIHFRVSLPPTVHYHRQKNDGRQTENMWTGIRNIRIYWCIKNEFPKREIWWWSDITFWRDILCDDKHHSVKLIMHDSNLIPIRKKCFHIWKMYRLCPPGTFDEHLYEHFCITSAGHMTLLLAF